MDIVSKILIMFNTNTYKLTLSTVLFERDNRAEVYLDLKCIIYLQRLSRRGSFSVKCMTICVDACIPVYMHFTVYVGNRIVIRLGECNLGLRVTGRTFSLSISRMRNTSIFWEILILPVSSGFTILIQFSHPDFRLILRTRWSFAERDIRRDVPGVCPVQLIPVASCAALK